MPLSGYICQTALLPAARGQHQRLMQSQRSTMGIYSLGVGILDIFRASGRRHLLIEIVAFEMEAEDGAVGLGTELGACLSRGIDRRAPTMMSVGKMLVVPCFI